MNLRPPKVVRRRLSLGVLIFVVIATTSAASIWFLSGDARREINALAIANADSTQWSLAQSEVEFLGLAVAVRDGQTDTVPGLGEIRRRFDVFYSRVQTLRASASFDDVRQLPEIAAALDRLERFLEASVVAIDRSDAELLAALPKMQVQIEDLRDEIRDISLAGVKLFAQRSETSRERVADALRDLGIITFFLLAVLFAVVAVLFLIMQSTFRKSSEIAITQNRLQAIISTSLDGILVVGRDGRVIDYNGAAEGIFGYSRSETIGADMAELIIPAL